MKANIKKVVWTHKAVLALNDHVAFLNKKSPTAAKRVALEILQTTRSLATAAEIFQLDEYRANPNENIRRFFRWNYKVVYQVFESEVVILDIIHTSKNPSPNSPR